MDADILKIPVFEIDEIPLYWRKRARAYFAAKKEALQSIAKDSEALPVFVLDL